MEASERKNALKYAVVAMIVRFVTSQSSVFSLWYSRRCYERSRGEMIMMLYEKTLSRKINVIPPQSAVVEHQNGDSANDLRLKQTESLPKVWWRKLYEVTKGLLSRKDKVHQKGTEEADRSASMGKILNLMRYVIQLRDLAGA